MFTQRDDDLLTLLAADGEVHISETALNVLAARRWNLIAA